MYLDGIADRFVIVFFFDFFVSSKLGFINSEGKKKTYTIVYVNDVIVSLTYDYWIITKTIQVLNY